MTRLLPLYLNRLFAVRVLAAAAALAGLLQLLELLEVTTEVLERGLGAGGVLRYAALRLPTLLPQVLPLATLVGAALTLAALAGRSEITALRAAGVSLYRLVLTLLPTAAVVAVAHLAAAELVAPSAERELTAWWARSAPAQAEGETRAKWFRLDGDLVSIGRVSADGRRLQDLRVYHRDAGGGLESRVLAPVATWTGGAWRLPASTTTRLTREGPVAGAPQPRVWRTSLTPDVAVNLTRGEGRIAAMAARQSLRGQGVADQSTAYYATRLQRSLAEPLAAFAMLLLAAPVARASQRGGRQALWLIAALGAGLAFMLVDGLLASFGQTAVLPPVVGAWAALALALGAGLWALLNIEG